MSIDRVHTRHRTHKSPCCKPFSILFSFYFYVVNNSPTVYFSEIMWHLTSLELTHVMSLLGSGRSLSFQLLSGLGAGR